MYIEGGVYRPLLSCSTFVHKVVQSLNDRSGTPCQWKSTWTSNEYWLGSGRIQLNNDMKVKEKREWKGKQVKDTNTKVHSSTMVMDGSIPRVVPRVYHQNEIVEGLECEQTQSDKAKGTSTIYI